MKFTLSWLKKFLDFEHSLEELCIKLNQIGLEVEEVTNYQDKFAKFTIAEILAATPHPDADKLQICKVTDGTNNFDIVCGAPNARAGIKVVLAYEDAIIPKGNFKIKKAKIRGVESRGMMCSEQELGIGNDSNGIIELPQQASNGESFLKYYGLDDPIIEVAITPNRGDWLGVYGIARDLAAANFGKLKNLDIRNLENNLTSQFKVKTENKNEAALFIGRHIKNLKNCQSPTWLKNYLKAIDMEPISALVDITNYISYSFARPLHVYDAQKISGDLTINFAKNGEKFIALDNNEYELSETDLVVRDAKQVQALAGIIGGLESGCDLNTTEVILEAALFNPVTIAKTGRRLKINTDSRYRFERNVDPDFTIEGARIASQLIEEICGGEAAEFTIDGDIKTAERHLEFDIEYIEKLLGVKIAKEQVTQILEKLGFEIISQNNNFLNLKIPSWRADINIKQDIVEEIARIYGYDHIPLAKMPSIGLEANRLLSAKQKNISLAKRNLAAQGFYEVVSWSFMAENDASNFTELNKQLKLVNPIAAELNYMRPTIIANLLKMAAANNARSLYNLCLFEVGPIFKSINLEDEFTAISALRSGNLTDRNIHNTARAIDIYDIKANLENLFIDLNFSFNKLQIVTPGPDYLHPGRSAYLKLGKNIVGFFGEVHPEIIETFDIKENVVCFEVILENIPEAKLKHGQKGELKISNYQSVNRDFAFIADIDLPVNELIKAIANIDKKLIKEINIFDIYQGDKIEKGKKSIALNILLQADSHTLTEQELSDISNKIIEVAKNNNALLRTQ